MAREPVTRPGSKYRAIDFVVVMACLLAGGMAVVSRTADDGADLYGERQLDTPESATLFMCPVDGAMLSVTPAGFDRLIARGEVGPREGSPPRTRGLYVRCPECGKRRMVAAARCPEHGTAFAASDEHGEPCMCPRCFAEILAQGDEPEHATGEAG